MQAQNSILDDLKRQYKSGGVFMRLIFINVAIFLALRISMVFAELTGSEGTVGYYIGKIFFLETNIDGFIRSPWALFTSIFAHYSFLHILMNMVFLYFAGRFFEQLFNGRRLLYTYILGGIAGGLLEIVAHLVFPALYGSDIVVVGASGSIMAIFVAVAFYQPNLRISLLFLPPFKIIWIAVAYIGLDLLSLSANDGVAHFAHIGGALVGILSVQSIHSSRNIITAFGNGVDWFINLFKGNKKPKLKVKKGRDVRMMTDEEYNADAKARQDEINRILDKISKSGYDSLTKREKDFLFDQSKND